MAKTDKRDIARVLKPIGDGSEAHTPFPYDAHFLANIQSDQKPRYYGAMTDPGSLPRKSVPLDQLFATQDRVDPKKVEAIRAAMDETQKASKKKPIVVVHMNGRHYIADGHHRAAAEWLGGATNIDAGYMDLEPQSNALKGAGAAQKSIFAKVESVTTHGVVLGWAIVCKMDGEDYYDLQGDHIPEDAMLEASVDFMQGDRMAKEMHEGDAAGTVMFALPVTTEIAQAFGWSTAKTGLVIGMKPAAAEMVEKFRDGTYTGFSIGGWRIQDEEVAA